MGLCSLLFSFCIHRQKGSDASWEHDIEPPEEHLDYSDDEEERAARRRLQDKRRAEAEGEGQGETSTVTEERTEKKSECLCKPSVFRLFVVTVYVSCIPKDCPTIHPYKT